MQACGHVHTCEYVCCEREYEWCRPPPHPSCITFPPSYLWRGSVSIPLHKREIIYFDLTEECSPVMSDWALVQTRQFWTNLGKVCCWPHSCTQWQTVWFILKIKETYFWKCSFISLSFSGLCFLLIFFTGPQKFTNPTCSIEEPTGVCWRIAHNSLLSY